ncbi:dTMP kinase, partial [Candidatus Curtissbacteria bacterium]|nr:dTMP kinase [Candidatus Curtissbacteria bacterium]
MSRTQGKFIVFEGADGTGKTTQAKFLYHYLKKRKVPAEFISFPRYADNLWGKLVRRYLDGEFGNISSVNPYLASVLYAGDRLLASEKIRKWLAQGKTVVCDRYMASNIAHQAAKIKDQKLKIKYIKWLEDFEFGQNKIPKPDLVILLTIPTEVAQKFMRLRKLDIHEKDIRYQMLVAKAFEEYARTQKSWAIV